MPQESIKLSAQYQAQLKALGVTVYEPVKQITLAEQPWLNDLCLLLNITTDACQFDATAPLFDDKTQTLHLPAHSFANEADLKKLIWQHVRQFVS
jgi:hypothetical protein